MISHDCSDLLVQHTKNTLNTHYREKRVPLMTQAENSTVNSSFNLAQLPKRNPTILSGKQKRFHHCDKSGIFRPDFIQSHEILLCNLLLALMKKFKCCLCCSIT